MSIKKTAFVFLLLISQFCAKAQNWQSIGGGYMDSTMWIIGFSVDSNNLIAASQVLTYPRFLVYNSDTLWDTLGNKGPTIQTVKYRNEYYAIDFHNLSGFYRGVCKLVNGTWQPFAETTTSCIGITVIDTNLYVLGRFDSIAGIAAHGVARYDGTNWNAIGNANWSTGSGAYCATKYQGDLYVGGGFHSPNSYNCLAKWDGIQWQNFGAAFTGFLDGVNCFAEYNGYLYVGGYFTTASGSPGNMIARWDGSTWTQVGGGITGGQVLSMKVYNNELWVGGQISTAGGISTPYLAKYDGMDWCNVGNFDNSITAIEVFNGELYIGGGFWTVDGDSVSKVLKWIGGNNTNQCGHLNTGISETENLFSVHVFPNPATTSTTFQVTGNIEPYELVIFDPLGREIYRRKNNTTTLEVETTEFAAGLYFYTVLESDRIRISGKLVVE